MALVLFGSQQRVSLSPTHVYLHARILFLHRSSFGGLTTVKEEGWQHWHSAAMPTGILCASWPRHLKVIPVLGYHVWLYERTS